MNTNDLIFVALGLVAYVAFVWMLTAVDEDVLDRRR
jgi:hypothetical protein